MKCSSYIEIFNLLTKLGLSETETQIYLHLATRGPEVAKDITTELNLPKRQVNHSLKVLAQKHLVAQPEEVVDYYAAVPFEEVLSGLQATTLEDAIRIEQKRQDALTAWRSLIAQK